LPEGLPIHHLAFRVDRVNFNAAQDTLRQKGLEFEIQDHKIVHSIYFYDPDGYLLELTTYELSDKVYLDKRLQNATSPDSRIRVNKLNE
jgi:Lactoylglutathione lyase and related lyases